MFERERRLGRSGIRVSAMGLGCWEIGGPTVDAGGIPGGLGEADDAESLRALGEALDAGISFFDTSNAYGPCLLEAYRPKRVLYERYGASRRYRWRRSG